MMKNTPNIQPLFCYDRGTPPTRLLLPLPLYNPIACCISTMEKQEDGQATSRDLRPRQRVSASGLPSYETRKFPVALARTQKNLE